jgi:biopolymer transport protein ExbB
VRFKNLEHLMRHGLVLVMMTVLLQLGAALHGAPVHAQEPAPASVQETSPTPDAFEPGAVPARGSAKAFALDPQIHDLSPWRMFMGADIVVKGVMIGLAFASLVTWTVFLAKSAELTLAKARLRKALRDLQAANSLASARAVESVQNTVLTDLLVAAERELSLSADIADTDGVKERVGSMLSEVVKTEAANIRRGMGLLATIGATAPFVGLFGTVWGIMNSFIGISKAQTTNLAVVAPGIAEALLATAIGLVAAIPAVIIYNHFSRGTKSYVDLVGRASGATGRLLSRDLDRRGHQTPFTLARA